MSTSFVITVYCAEGLRLEASGVVDALMARGYDAEIMTGPNARDALRRQHADSRSRLRVLLVGSELEPSKLVALHRGLDPGNRGNLLVLKLDGTAWDLGERIASFERQVRRRRVVRVNTGAVTHPLPSVHSEPRPFIAGAATASATAPARALPAAPAFASFPEQTRRRGPWWAAAAVGAVVGAGLLLYPMLQDRDSGRPSAGGSTPAAPVAAPVAVAGEPAPASTAHETGASPSGLTGAVAPAPTPELTPTEPFPVEELVEIVEDAQPIPAVATKPKRRAKAERRLKRQKDARLQDDEASSESEDEDQTVTEADSPAPAAKTDTETELAEKKPAPTPVEDATPPSDAPAADEAPDKDTEPNPSDPAGVQEAPEPAPKQDAKTDDDAYEADLEDLPPIPLE